MPAANSHNTERRRQRGSQTASQFSSSSSNRVYLYVPRCSLHLSPFNARRHGDKLNHHDDDAELSWYRENGSRGVKVERHTHRWNPEERTLALRCRTRSVGRVYIDMECPKLDGHISEQDALLGRRRPRRFRERCLSEWYPIVTTRPYGLSPYLVHVTRNKN